MAQELAGNGRKAKKSSILNEVPEHMAQEFPLGYPAGMKGWAIPQ